MGGEISVFEEDQLEKDLDFLSKDESLIDLFHRSLSDMTNVITKPKRLQYDVSWLIPVTSTAIGSTSRYLIVENIIKLTTCYDQKGENILLSTVLWYPSSSVSMNLSLSSYQPPTGPTSIPLLSTYNSSNILIIYIHTNGRASPDALELLPLCDILSANLFAFDCKGCGKSSGQYSLSNAYELSEIIQLFTQQNPSLEIILWGRGMGTNSVIESLNLSNCSKNIKFIVLDSPFTSLHDIVKNAAASIDTVGITVPSVFVKFALFMMRKSAKAQLGSDPYLIRPIDLVNSISIPCYIISADEDDYIPDSMGKEIAQSWSGKCWYRIFPGKHIGERDPGITMSTIDKILPYVALPEGISIDTPSQCKNDETITVNKVSHPSNLNQMTINDRRDSMTAVWKSDNSSDSCEVCQISFTLINRRHHCRNCGSLVCHSCSKKKLILHTEIETNEMNQPVRVCDICFDGLTCQLNPEKGADEVKF